MRLCRHCNQEKPESRFYTVKGRNGHMYLRNVCIDCKNAAVVEYNKQHPEIHREAFKRWFAKRLKADPTYAQRRRKRSGFKKTYNRLDI